MLKGEAQKVEDIEIIVVQLARLTQHAINDRRNLHRLRVGWRIVLGAGFGDNRKVRKPKPRPIRRVSP
jgi:hypothetical protein